MENTPNITNFAKLLKRQMINIKFPDGSSREYNEGTTPLEIAQSISPRLAQDVLAVKLDGNDYDLTRPVEKDASIQFFNGRMKRANTPSGILRPICSPKRFRNSSRA